MFTVHCPVCGSPQNHVLLLSGIAEYGDIYRCVHCELTRLLPLPTISQHLNNTQGMYKEHANSYDQNKADLAARSVAGYLSKVRSYRTKIDSLLDLGGGLGYYARAFAAHGLHVTYVDADAESSHFALPFNQRTNVASFLMPIEEFCVQGQDRKFDVIFFRHIIEHCLAPDKTLLSIRNVCHNQTILVLETDNNLGVELLFHPDTSRYWRGVYRDHYDEKSILKLCKLRPLAIDYTETHYYAFRHHNLSQLLNRTGWQVEDLFAYPLGDTIYWPNVPKPIDGKYWYPWRKFISARAFAYCFMRPIINILGWTSGLAMYARLRDHHGET